MKTIEQLADEYVGHPEEIDEFSSASIKRQAFIDGARTQKKIDEESYEGKALLYAINKTAERAKKELIDKDCEYIKANVNSYIALVGPELNAIVSGAFVEAFRYAMEEGL